MNIVILSTDPTHPVNKSLKSWKLLIESKGHSVNLIADVNDINSGDILFLVSCSAIINEVVIKKFRIVLVLHASDLPSGRGWSPHIWSILDGANEITVCLLEASTPIDTGNIWLKRSFRLKGYELLNEINEALFSVELQLMTEAVESFHKISPNKQSKDENAVLEPALRKRTPEDSRLDINKSILEQFNLLRVVDSQRYPAFFEHLGQRYKIIIEKDNG